MTSAIGASPSTSAASRVQAAPVAFPQLLAERASRAPARVALRYLGDGEAVTAELTYLDLYRRAIAVAELLRSKAPRGARVLVLHGNDHHYAIAFLGCLCAGMVAVPVFPPEPGHRQQLERLHGILWDASPTLVLTSERLAPAVRASLAALSSPAPIEVLTTDGVGPAAPGDHGRIEAPCEIAFLQYTSGSTATPKGVVVTHANLVANSRAIQAAFGIGDGDVVVSWLPLYHDMGLIGGLLQPFYSGVPLVLFSPEQFAANPARWLRAISRHRATVSGAPDFAYRMCVERVKPYQLDGLDLSSWQVAFSGAEPIRAATLGAFAEKFAPAGFRESALCGCYGLAEATLLVSAGVRGAGPTVRRFDAEALSRDVARAVEGGAAMVGCGDGRPDHEVIVADPDSGEPLAAGRVGEICVRGPSVSRGYWNAAVATGEAFVERRGRTWLRTGDLGFQHGGQLFIAGRRKDMLIVRGQNVYPQDIEETIAEEVEILRAGRVAAFPVDGAEGEGIGIAVEIGRGAQRLVDPAALHRAIAEVVGAAHGEPPVLLLLLHPGTMPMTSSGKLRRGECVRAWRAGALTPFAVFEPVASSPRRTGHGAHRAGAKANGEAASGPGASGAGMSRSVTASGPA